MQRKRQSDISMWYVVCGFFLARLLVDSEEEKKIIRQLNGIRKDK